MQNWKTRKFVTVLHNNGFIFLRSKGDHLVYGRNIERVVITADTVNGLIARKIIQAHELTV